MSRADPVVGVLALQGDVREHLVALAGLGVTARPIRRATELSGLDGIVIPGGFGERGTEGKIMAAGYAREHEIPCLGLCLGLQMMTIEYARNVLGLAGANSSELDPTTPHPGSALRHGW